MIPEWPYVWLYLSSFSTNLLTIWLRLLNIYILYIQFWHSTSVNVRLTYRFRALLILKQIKKYLCTYYLLKAFSKEISKPKNQIILNLIEISIKVIVYIKKILNHNLFIQEMIDEADREGKGEVAQDDFLRIMKKTGLYWNQLPRENQF